MNYCPTLKLNIYLYILYTLIFILCVVCLEKINLTILNNSVYTWFIYTVQTI